MKVKNKVIVVTGGANGMGRELVLHLLTKGSKVFAIDMNQSALEETKQLAGDKKDFLSFIVADVTNKKVIDQLPRKVLSTYGVIDGIINSAGIIQPFLKVNDMDYEKIERVFNINFYGTLYMIKAFLPHLIQRPEAHIVNVSSMGGFVPVAGQSIYGASKAAVKLLSEGLSSELSDTHVKVTTVVPGAMYTNIKANSGLGKEAGAGPEGHAANAALSPSVAAELIIEAIEKNHDHIYFGRDSKAMNLINRANPNLATRLIYKKIKHKI